MKSPNGPSKLRSSATIAALLVGAFLCLPAQAATFYVDQLTDDDGECTPGACSLREAALAANALPGLDILVLAPGVHELSIPGINETFGYTGDINFREPVEIHGSKQGKTIIDGNGIDGILDFFPFTNFMEHFRLSDLTLREGSRANYWGGAISGTAGYLDVDNCVFENNQAIQGGAIYIGNMQTVIRNSTFRNNAASYGGGAIFRDSAILPLGLLVENTTISGNTAFSVGGAMISGGDGVLTLRSSTIVGNSSPFASALWLDRVAPSELVVESTLLEGSCDWPGSTFPPTSLGGNLQTPGGLCYLNHPTDQEVADFGLGPLEPSENGYTHTPLPGSPAIDAAANCPAADQRGALRPQDGDGDGVALCDAGAYELGTPNGLAVIPMLGSLGLLLLAGGIAALGLRRLG